MKSLVQFAFLFLISVCLSGCATSETSNIYLQGNRSQVHSNCVFKLDGVMVKRIRSKNTDGSSIIWTPYDISTWGGFLLTFSENRNPLNVDSLNGSFEDIGGNLKPLKVVCRNETTALFMLNTNFSVICPRLEFGKYKVNLQYYFNGQTNVCNFELSYVMKSEKHYRMIMPWEWPMWWAYRRGGGP